MQDTFSSLSARSIALRVLPALIVFLMLLVGPPEAPRLSQPAMHGSASLESTGPTKALP